MCLWNIVWFNKQVIRLYRMTYMIEIIRYLCNCGNNAKQLLVIGYSVTLAFYPPPFWTVYVFLHPPVGIGVGVIQTLFAAHCLLRIRLEKKFFCLPCVTFHKHFPALLCIINLIKSYLYIVTVIVNITMKEFVM